MKKLLKSLLPLLIIFSGCSSPFQKTSLLLTDLSDLSPGMGRVIIGHDDPSGRTLLPNMPVFVSYTIGFQYQGGGGIIKAPESVLSLPCSVDLPTGSWLITVTAYTRIEGVAGLADGNYPAASGSVTVTVSSGTSVPVTVDLSSGTGLAGKGVLEYDIGLPAENTGVAVLKVMNMNKTEAASKNLLEAASGSIPLNSGYYLLQIQIATGRARSRTELIHIYSGHTTSAAGNAYNFNIEDGVYLSLAELCEFLAVAPSNTPNYPYPVKLMTNLESLASGTSSSVNVLGALFNGLEGKYISLDLSDASGNLAVYASAPENTAYYTSTTANRDRLVSLVLPDRITYIPPYTFSYCSSLKSINLPAALQKIGAEAFYNSGMIKADLSQYTNLQDIGSNGFRDCSKLEEIALPSSLQKIGAGAFYNTGIKKADLSQCTGLQEINSTAFNNCRFLTDVILPLNNGINLPDFSNCLLLNSLAFAGSQTSMTFSVSQRSWLKSVDLSACTALTAIGNNVFSGCTALEVIIFPASVTTINANAFKGCTSLRNFPNMPYIQNIGDSAFEGCTGLNFTSGKLDLSAYTKLVSLGNNAFKDCIQIASFVLPVSLESIGAVFSGCSNLISGLTTVDLSQYTSLKVINGTFNGFSNLVSVALPVELEIIGTNTFRNCSALTDINLPRTLKTIGDSAFRSCSNAQIVLKNMDLLSSVGSAFTDCAALSLIDLSGNKVLESIGWNAFLGCTSLASVDLSDCTALLNMPFFQDCTALESINFSGCTSMDFTSFVMGGNNAFRNCTSLKSVDLSGCTALTSIVNVSWTSTIFNGCAALEYVDLSGCSSLISIANSAFSGCTSLKVVNLASCTALENIGDSAFRYCSALITIDFDACTALKSIGAYAFQNCYALTAVDFSSTVLNTINSDSFNTCNSLKTVIFPKTITHIGDDAFYYCSALLSLNLSDCIYLSSIGNSAFYRCNSLVSADLSDCIALSTLGQQVFRYCTSLVWLIYPIVLLYHTWVVKMALGVKHLRIVLLLNGLIYQILLIYII